MSQLTNNTTNLQAILDTVNALPEAGTSVESYTVYIGTAEPTADIGNDGDIYIVRTVTA